MWRANMQVYGADKVWKQMNRERIAVARCTVERLMKQLGLRGVMRGKRVRTTVPDAIAPRPLDRVNRQFKAARPNQLDSVKQHGRFIDNHLGRSTGMIVGRYPVMVVAPCC
ncbi:hypothetical protein LMG24235_08678 [Paraburkholderia sabiae]|nr:hypothetical protein LMG24235_08678 [Paraburkholderia sabiae]